MTESKNGKPGGMKTALAGLLYLVVVCLSIEAAAQLAYRVHKGKWYLHDHRASPIRMYSIHPYLGCAPLPSVSAVFNGLRISHNSQGYRGPEFNMAKTPGRTRIVALGGSSTYGVGVSDEFTWPRQLQDQLGTNYEVINLAGNGGGSVEHVIQTALQFSDLKPDVAIYYCGWNDAHVQHIKNLKADYSDYHGKVATAVGLRGTQPEEPLASLYFLKRILFHHFFPLMDDPANSATKIVSPTEDAFTDRVDQRAIELWERNLRLLVTLCKAQGVRPVFVPQIMNWKVLVSDKSYGWFPYVRDRDIKKIMDAYHASMEKVAKEEGVSYVGQMLEVPFSASDFVDNGHFSAEGNKRFAEVLAKALQAR